MDSELRKPDISSYLQRPTEPALELPKLFPGRTDLTIFDIGACEGEDSIRYGRMYPQGRIFTFEPLPGNQALIRENFKQYHADNAQLVPLALSDKSGTAEFHVSSGKPPTLFAGENWNYGNKSSSLLPPSEARPMFGWVEFKQTITVQCETLDEFSRQRQIDRIAFIHMDVQGAEALVLQGAKRMLRRTTALWLEVSDKQLYQGQILRSDIEKIMKDAGFVLVFQKLREIEGDQFYANTRHPAVWIYLIKRKAERAWGWIRQKLSGVKRRLLAPRKRGGST